MNEREYRTSLLTGFVGLIGIILVGIGEFLLHFSTTGYAGAEDFLFLRTIPKTNLFVGHFFVVLFSSFYFVAYYHLYLSIKSGSFLIALSILLLGIYTFSIAGVWIGSRAQLALTVQLVDNEPSGKNLLSLIENYKLLIESLITIVRITVFLISGLFVYVVIKGNTIYPKWFSIFNPIVLLGLIFLSYLFVPAMGKYLVPTAMNVAHIIFVGISLWITIKNKNEIIINSEEKNEGI